jgi:hypothetical protein
VLRFAPRSLLALLPLMAACAQTDVIAREHASAANPPDAGSDAATDAAGSCPAAPCPPLPDSAFALCACTEIVATSAIVTPSGTSTGSGDDCACTATTPLDIAALVASHANASDNDNLSAALDPTFFDGFDVTPSDPAVELGCGRYYLPSFHGRGPLRLHITGHALLYVDSDLALDDDFSVTLAPGAALDLFLTGNLRASGRFDLGRADAAPRANLYVAGNGTIDIAGGAQIAGLLYAPSAELVTRGTLATAGPVLVRRAAPLGPVTLSYEAGSVLARCQ